MLSLTLMTALLVAQQPPAPKPLVTSRRHKAGESVEKRIDDLTLDLIGGGEMILDLQRRVEALEAQAHKCRCGHARAVVPRPEMAPAPAKPPAAFSPVYQWRTVVGYPGLHYYGYEQDGVFRVQYQRYDGPPPVRYQAGCAGGACGR